jgi:hypothetical protein
MLNRAGGCVVDPHGTHTHAVRIPTRTMPAADLRQIPGRGRYEIVRIDRRSLGGA